MCSPYGALQGGSPNPPELMPHTLLPLAGECAARRHAGWRAGTVCRPYGAFV